MDARHGLAFLNHVHSLEPRLATRRATRELKRDEPRVVCRFFGSLAYALLLWLLSSLGLMSRDPSLEDTGGSDQVYHDRREQTSSADPNDRTMDEYRIPAPAVDVVRPVRVEPAISWSCTRALRRCSAACCARGG